MESLGLHRGEEFCLFSVTYSYLVQMMLSLMKSLKQKILFYLKLFQSSLANTNR